MQHRPTNRLRAVRTWLWTIYGFVFLMVVVGGTTRLTGSGLSMVEWHPLMGALPPVTTAHWQEVFAQYKHSPQYQQVNTWMTLADFERIFLWEYVHRLIGRLIGVVVLVPWLYFLLRGTLSRTLTKQTLGLFLLGGCQGLLGWFMVKSGLVEMPEVSHYRLAAHLLLAFLIGMATLWILLDQYREHPERHLPNHRRPRSGTFLLFLLVLLQILYGAFTAGTHAGLLYSTFPTMNGQWIPEGIASHVPLWTNLFDNPITIHFLHRLLGLAVFVASCVFLWHAQKLPRATRRGRRTVAALVVGQVALGIATVVLSVPTVLAVAHQATAYFLLSAIVVTLHAEAR